MLLSIFQRLFALASLAVLAIGGYFLWSWWQLHEILQPQPGENLDTDPWRLWLGVGLIAWSLLGRLPLALFLGRNGHDADRLRRDPGMTLETSTGAQLHVETSGPQDAPVLIFVHGWGLDAGIWWEARRMLSERFEVVVYDLAGLGKSKRPADGRVSLDRYADDLLAVVGRAAPRKVILVGHSIGGMIVQTFCRRYPETLNRQVLGVVIENSTPVDPSRTTILGEALHAMKPVLVPLMRLDILLQPVVWAMNWQSYLSGSTHLAMRFGGFGTTPTKAQLNQVSLAATRNSPAVQARGNIAMMHWEGAAQELPAMRIPALIFIGGRDIVTVPDAGETIANRMPQARPVRLDDGGHLGPLELAEDYNAAIAQFADDVFTRGARSADAADTTPREAPPAGSSGYRSPGEPRPFA